MWLEIPASIINTSATCIWIQDVVDILIILSDRRIDV